MVSTYTIYFYRIMFCSLYLKIQMFIFYKSYSYSMRCVIVYWSRYGNGKRIVKELTKMLKSKGSKVTVLNSKKTRPNNFPDADMYIFSAPAEKFTIPKDMRKIMKGLKDMEYKRYGIINTHGMKRNWLGKMEKWLSKKKMIKVAEIDFRMGDNTAKGEGLQDGWKNELKRFATKLQ